jgi:hypothetical protein
VAPSPAVNTRSSRLGLATACSAELTFLASRLDLAPLESVVLVDGGDEHCPERKAAPMAELRMPRRSHIDVTRDCLPGLIRRLTSGVVFPAFPARDSRRGLAAFVYVADTKSDKIYQYSINPATGKITPMSPATSQHDVHCPAHSAVPKLSQAAGAREQRCGVLAGLPAGDQILGGSAADLLHRAIP